MLAIRTGSDRQIRRGERRMDGAETDIALSSVGRIRIRPGAVIFKPVILLSTDYTDYTDTFLRNLCNLMKNYQPVALLSTDYTDAFLRNLCNLCNLWTNSFHI